MNLEHIRFGNGAGTIRQLSEVKDACRSAMTDITVGSITADYRSGNQPDPGGGRTYYWHPKEKWSLNSLGLPNPGIVEYLKTLPTMARVTHSAGKNFRTSVAGFTPEEYALLAAQCFESGADEVEQNLGCPNIWGHNKTQKPIPSYDPELVEEILWNVRQIPLNRKVAVAVKISPVADHDILLSLLRVCGESTIVSRIVAVNTIPNQERLAEDGSQALSFNGGNHAGGLAGSAILEQSLEVVRIAVNAADDWGMEVSGVGGISSGETAFKSLELGATGFQCATAFIEQGLRLFSDISEKMADLI